MERNLNLLQAEHVLVVVQVILKCNKRIGLEEEDNNFFYFLEKLITLKII